MSTKRQKRLSRERGEFLQKRGIIEVYFEPDWEEDDDDTLTTGYVKIEDWKKMHEDWKKMHE